MTDGKQMIRDEIAAMRKVLNGETVNGVRLGMAGITVEWLQSRIDACEWILANR